ncbi:MAG: type II toxin-antitoxin system HicA family toxin [Candidatus Binatia bacterium]
MRGRIETIACRLRLGNSSRDLEKAGFVDRGGKGSHRNFVHPKMARPVTVSGKPGDDAKRYQIRAVQLAVEESKK